MRPVSISTADRSSVSCPQGHERKVAAPLLALLATADGDCCRQRQLDEYRLSSPLSPQGRPRFVHPRLLPACLLYAPPDYSCFSLSALAVAGVAESRSLFRLLADPDSNLEQLMTAHKRLMGIIAVLEARASSSSRQRRASKPRQECISPADWSALLYRMIFHSVQTLSLHCAEMAHLPGFLSCSAPVCAGGGTQAAYGRPVVEGRERWAWNELADDARDASYGILSLRSAQQLFLQSGLVEKVDALLGSGYHASRRREPPEGAACAEQGARPVGTVVPDKLSDAAASLPTRVKHDVKSERGLAERALPDSEQRKQFFCSENGETRVAEAPDAVLPAGTAVTYDSSALLAHLLAVVQDLDLLDKEAGGGQLFQACWSLSSRGLRHHLSRWYLALARSQTSAPHPFALSLAINDPEVGQRVSDTPPGTVRMHLSSDDSGALCWLWHKGPQGVAGKLFELSFPVSWLGTRAAPGLRFVEYLYFLQENMIGVRTAPFSFRSCCDEEQVACQAIWFFHASSQRQVCLEAMESCFQTWRQQAAFRRYLHAAAPDHCEKQEPLVAAWLIEPLAAVLEPVLSAVQDCVFPAGSGEGGRELVVSGDYSSALIPWEHLPLLPVGEPLITGARLSDLCPLRMAPVAAQIAAPVRVVDAREALPRLFFPLAVPKDESPAVAADMQCELTWMQEELVVPFHRLSERREPQPPADRHQLMASLELPGIFHMAGKGCVQGLKLTGESLPAENQERPGGDGLGPDAIPLDMVTQTGSALVVLNVCATGVFSCHPHYVRERFLHRGAAALVSATDLASSCWTLFRPFYHLLLCRPEADLQASFDRAQAIHRLCVLRQSWPAFYSYTCCGGPVRFVRRGLCPDADQLCCSYRYTIDRLAPRRPEGADKVRVLYTRGCSMRTRALGFLCGTDPSVTCSLWLPITGTCADLAIHKLIAQQLQMLPEPEAGHQQTLVYAQSFFSSGRVNVPLVQALHPRLQQAHWYIEDADRCAPGCPPAYERMVKEADALDFERVTLPASLLKLGFRSCRRTADLMDRLLSFPCLMETATWRLLEPRLQMLSGMRERERALEALVQALQGWEARQAGGEQIDVWAVLMAWIEQPMTPAERALLLVLDWLKLPVDELFCQLLLEHPAFCRLEAGAGTAPGTAGAGGGDGAPPYWRRLLDAMRAGVHRYLVDRHTSDEQLTLLARAWQGEMDRTLVFIPARLDSLLSHRGSLLFFPGMEAALEATLKHYVKQVAPNPFKLALAALVTERLGTLLPQSGQNIAPQAGGDVKAGTKDLVPLP
ncbi:MAG: hypothetical protein OXC07_07270 [Kistimonas sp.]|nr:hypothetical protein [Kistimonas sp.]